MVLPSVTYTLVVCGASEPEIATVQDFLERRQKKRYISVRLNVRALLEKQYPDSTIIRTLKTKAQFLRCLFQSI